MREPCITIDADTYGTGSVDASAAINTALQNCPDNQAVYLPAGTYLLNSPISFSGRNNRTLRGAGPGATVLRPVSTVAIQKCVLSKG